LHQLLIQPIRFRITLLNDINLNVARKISSGLKKAVMTGGFKKLGR